MMDCDIVIVGAGIAGLSAAYELHKTAPQLKVKVIEAKPRVGGRTLTITMTGAKGNDQWDLGGQWVGSTQHHILELLEELNIKTYDQYITGLKRGQIGSPSLFSYKTDLPSLTLIETVDFAQLFVRLHALSKRFSPLDPLNARSAEYLDSISTKELVRNMAWTRAVRECVDIGAIASNGCRSGEMSALYAALYGGSCGGIMNQMEAVGEGAQRYKVAGGAQQICQRLHEILGNDVVTLAAPVSKVVQSSTSDICEVHFGKSNSILRCKRIIIAIPPHQAGKIQYEPALPHNKQQLLWRYQSGNLLKFLVTYQKAFWRGNGMSGEIAATGFTDEPGSFRPVVATYDATSYQGNAAIVGFINLHPFSDWTPTDRRKAVLEDLARYLGPDALHCLDYQDKNWALEPYGGGCPAGVLPPGNIEYFLTIRDIDGKLHWAGTETASEWMGYMSGARQSGLRVAHEVLYHMLPQKVDNSKLEGSVLSPQYKRPKQMGYHYNKSSGLVKIFKISICSIVGVMTLRYLFKQQLENFPRFRIKYLSSF